MPRYPLLWIAALFVPGLIAPPLQAKPFSSPIIEDSIQILDNRLIYKNKSVAIPMTRKSLIKVFGKPSREIYNTAGTMVIWDELGLTCYGCQVQSDTPEEFQYMSKEEKQQIKPVERIDSITLFVRKYNPYPELEKKYAHEPRSPFHGKLELDGVDLDGTVSFEDFVEKRQSNFTILLPDNTFSFFIRCKPSPHEVTLHSIRDRYNEDYLSVYAVSIRNVSQYYKRLPCIDVFNLQDTPEPVELIKKQRLEEESPNNFEAMDAAKQKAIKDKPTPPAATPNPTPLIDAPVPLSEPGDS